MAPMTQALARRHLATVAAATLVAVLSTACGGNASATAGGTGGGNQTAADFIRQVTTHFSRGQSGRLWDTLHPADQAVVTRARYTECQSNSGFDLKKFKVLETYSETVNIAGKVTPSTAVSVQATSDDGVTTATMHAISLNGTWHWMLSPSDYRAYKQGKCLST
jgi:hypothetical protein